jgi:hypothetical protein
VVLHGGGCGVVLHGGGTLGEITALCHQVWLGDAGEIRFVVGEILEVARDPQGEPIYRCRRVTRSGSDDDVLHNRSHREIRLPPTVMS